jgi:hypothetical protein
LEVAIFNAGALNVNLHSSALLPGEIGGQLTDTGRALVENIPSGGVVNGRNFDNKSTAPPPEGVPDDNCSCIIGIFETDNTHDWELMWTGATTSSMVSTALKVATLSVNSSESGTIVVTIKDENSATTTITVTHPTTLGDENTVEQPLLLIPGKRYPLTVAYTGTAHQYKLGSKDKYLAIGQEDISCLESVEQDWNINVESGEVVKLTFTTDSSSNGGNQTGQFKITIRNASSGIVTYLGATTTILMDTAITVTVGASAAAEMWTVELDVLDGHIRMMKGSGSDRFFYIEPCPEQVEEPDRDPPTPVPGVGTWGLVVMTRLLRAAFVCTVRRRIRRVTQN